jgi:hypothetical protein
LALLPDPELVEQYALLEAVLVVAHASGDEVDIGCRGEWDGWGLVSGGPVGLRPKGGGVWRVVALGNEGALDLLVEPVVAELRPIWVAG